MLFAVAELLVTFQMKMCMFCTFHVCFPLFCYVASAFVICVIKNYLVTYTWAGLSIGTKSVTLNDLERRNDPRHLCGS